MICISKIKRIFILNFNLSPCILHLIQKFSICCSKIYPNWKGENISYYIWFYRKESSWTKLMLHAETGKWILFWVILFMFIINKTSSSVEVHYQNRIYPTKNMKILYFFILFFLLAIYSYVYNESKQILKPYLNIYVLKIP